MGSITGDHSGVSGVNTQGRSGISDNWPFKHHDAECIMTEVARHRKLVSSGNFGEMYILS